MSDLTVEFSRLCIMFDRVVHVKKGPQKRKQVRMFLDIEYTSHEYFSALRLMLPSLDKERANYGLKETVLGKFLAEALCLSKDSADAQKLLNWRKGGTSAGSNAGNFAFIAAEILYRRQPVTSKGLKIKDVNDLLDRLAAADKREEKVAVLVDMISKTNAQEMRWIIMIILKGNGQWQLIERVYDRAIEVGGHLLHVYLKLGISEKTIFGEFHPDAEDLFNVTCDLKLVCEKLRNRNARYNRQDIEVGKAVRPQLAARVASVEEAWKKFRGKQVTVECKFDGDRIQIHKDGTHVYFYSRSFIDHQHFKEGMTDFLVQNIHPDKCILDGEMLVWDSSNNRFAEFGTNREAAKAAKEGLETSQQLCYVAFDLLYHGGTSVIHLPLRERQELLYKAVRPVKGRLELLHPNAGLNNQRSSGEPKWSIIASSAEEVQHFFQDTVENREEGIILKDLDSKWEPSDRSGKWLKLKPDYVHTGSDLDVLIIGGYFGSGRRGGQVAQFLLGIAERPKAGEFPTRFSSFCRVGTGLTDAECDHLVQKLNPYFRRNEKNSRPPNCYTVTNNAKERPDVWVDQPDKSVILEITSDIRAIDTDVFAAPYGLRFPRVSRVRYDKPWYDCLDVQALVDMVKSGGGSTMDFKGYGKLEKKPRQSKRPKKADIHSLPLVPSHMRVTDVSNVKRTTQIFTDLVFYFVNNPEELSKESLHKLVVENGGSFSMNLNDDVTHAIASERKGLKFQASASHGDVIHYSWIIDCCTTKTLLPVRPKYFLHLSNETKEKMKADIDEYGDYYFVDIDASDLSQLFENMDPAKLATDCDELGHYKKKYCPGSTFCQFSNCHFYFHKPIHSSNPDSQMVAEITLKRQELEVGMHAGTVSGTLDSNVTHMIVFTSSEQSLPFRAIFKSIPHEDRRLLRSDKLKILSHRWVDDHVLGVCGYPSEEKYDLRNASFQYNEQDMDSCPTVEPSDNQDGGNASGDTTKANGSKKHQANLAELSQVPSKELLTLENPKHGKQPRITDNVKTEKGLVDRRKGGPHQTEHLASLAEVNERPLKRLVTIEKLPRHRKRPRGDHVRNTEEHSVKGGRVDETGAPKTETKEEPDNFVVTNVQRTSPEQKVAQSIDGNSSYQAEGDAKIFSRKDHSRTAQTTDGSSSHQAEGGGELSAREDHAGTGQVSQSHQERVDSTLDAFIGEMFPTLNKSQQLLPTQSNSSLSGAELPISETRDKNIVVELPSSRSGNSSLPSTTDTVPTSHNLPTKKKVSYKALVSGLLKP